jgi:RNA polymerase sigma factor (sigma-70 family)
VTAAPQLAEDLFNEHYRRLYAYCLRQLGSPEEAEDAVQATYLNACRSLKAGFEPDIAQAWLFKVAHNVCLTRQRSSYRRARVERPHDLHAVQDVVAAPEGAGDELFGLDEALAGLPEQQRNAILLREWQGLSYREVAAKLEISQAAVETLIFRARRSLASALEQPVRHRRRLVHSFDLSALLAGVKTALAGNLSASIATGIAVAASVTAIAATPVVKALDFPSHAPQAVVEPSKQKVSPHRQLPDRDDPRVHVTSGSAPAAVPGGWAGAHPRAVGKDHAKPKEKGKGEAQGQGKAKGKGKSNPSGRGNGQRANGEHSQAPASPPGPTHVDTHGQSQATAPAHGQSSAPALGARGAKKRS